MVGVGITPEGINQNYVMYEFALDRAWQHLPTDVPKWINEYTLSRYGIQNEHIDAAWKILKVRITKLMALELNFFLFLYMHFYFTINRTQFIHTMVHHIMESM